MFKKPITAAIAVGVIMVVVMAILGPLGFAVQGQSFVKVIGWLLFGPAIIFFVWGLFAHPEGSRPFYYGLLAAGAYIITYLVAGLVLNLLFGQFTGLFK
ncbi:MAG: hypothetical protein ONB44_11125 [candidate division KSB1 bacterium]|nr:hypothetical protein [candidate division KSB1 bacterium]MDZ7302675.1 hypothetical protein [candidate division KSB1 bacterium]MDZ7311794.1 hypothetical protein [candidate division KSB1 bacterium]